MDLRIAIGNDDANSQDLLQWMIRRWASTQALSCRIEPFTDEASLLYEAEDGAVFDVLLLPERLGGSSGLALARKLRAMHCVGALVMLVESRMCAVRSYEVGAVGCLTQPYDITQLDRVMTRACHRLPGEKLQIRMRGGSRYVSASEILYVESENNRCHIHSNSGAEYMMYCKLDDIQQSLHDGVFLRCHKSFLVNMNAVRDVDEASFVLIDGSTVPIRQRGRSGICKRYGMFRESQEQIQFPL